MSTPAAGFCGTWAARAAFLSRECLPIERICARSGVCRSYIYLHIDRLVHHPRAVDSFQAPIRPTNPANMTNYKLTYFDKKARAEVSRMLFAIAGVPYEDVRISLQDWPERKKDAPFAQLPVLEVDGRRFCQSLAIELFLARRFGLAGETEWDEVRAIMIRECVLDLWNKCVLIFRETDEKQKVEKRKAFVENAMDSYLKNLENLLIENDGGDGYFVSEKISFADVAFFHYTGMIPALTGIIVNWNKWPKLKALIDRVASYPAIANWIENRPNSAI